MRAPWAGVPLPGGKPVPSGGMLISQAVRSDSATGFPSPGPSAAIATPKPRLSANIMAESLTRSVNQKGIKEDLPQRRRVRGDFFTSNSPSVSSAPFDKLLRAGPPRWDIQKFAQAAQIFTPGNTDLCVDMFHLPVA